MTYGHYGVIWILVWLGCPLPCSVFASADDPKEREHAHALIVGIDRYANPKIPDLDGAANDARRIHQLLSGPNGFGFPAKNMRMLIDDQASLARFQEELAAMATRLEPDSQVVLYFAGYGSQTSDLNGDESDHMDETLVFHDSRTVGVPDLDDDAFFALLAGLHRKTSNIVVILDAGHAGGSTRGGGMSRSLPFLARVDAVSLAEDRSLESPLPGMVFLSAAAEGTSAMEANGFGVFTDALYHVWSRAYDHPPTYADTSYAIRQRVKALRYQTPLFQGDLDKWVLGTASRKRPISWEVIQIGEKDARGLQVVIAGPPMPGLGKGAELRVYDETARAGAFRNPAQSKGILTVDRVLGLRAESRFQAFANAKPPRTGDLAILARAGHDTLRIKVRIRPPEEAHGIAAPRAKAIQATILADPEAGVLVALDEHAGEFELIQNNEGRLQLLGPENRVRVTYEGTPDTEGAVIAANLWQHARIKAFLHLEGEGGLALEDHKTLQVSLTPAPHQPPNVTGSWQQAPPNQVQVVPFGHIWKVRVTLDAACPQPLLVGGVILSSDGALLGFPTDGGLIRIEPGRTHTFNESFVGGFPLNVEDHILIFGTTENDQVSWQALTQAARTRGSLKSQSSLFRDLDRYLSLGTRGGGFQLETEAHPWCLSMLTLRVEAAASSITGDPYRVSN